mgnify:CR=1 FL=1
MADKGERERGREFAREIEGAQEGQRDGGEGAVERALLMWVVERVARIFLAVDERTFGCCSTSSLQLAMPERHLGADVQHRLLVARKAEREVRALLNEVGHVCDGLLKAHQSAQHGRAVGIQVGVRRVGRADGLREEP